MSQRGNRGGPAPAKPRGTRKHGTSAVGQRQASRHEAALDALTRDALAESARLRRATAGLLLANHADRHRDSRFAELYDFVPMPYVLLSRVGVILNVNRAGEELLAASREWMVGRPLVVFVDRAYVRPMLNHLMSCNRTESRTLEVCLRTMNGPRTVRLVTRCDPASERTGVSYHTALVDLTDVRRLDHERRLAEAERQLSDEAEKLARATSEAKDQFIANLSHELRTPLTPILAAADALVHDSSLSEQGRSKVEIIRRNVRAEARLIDDLLDVARIRQDALTIEARPIDVHAVVRDVVESWRAHLAKLSIRLEMHLDAGRHHASADPNRLGQVFRNLLSNASKFTSAGGCIEVRSQNAGVRMVLTVTDTGVGIGQEKLRGLFESFATHDRRQQRAGGGLGLGLVISRAIVEAHQGQLTLASAGHEQGTTATVELLTIPPPAADAVVPAAPAPAPTPTEAEAGATTVLLVEDDRDSARMLALLLSTEGYEVRVAHSMSEARPLLPNCDIIVSDIGLPDGSGLDLIREASTNNHTRAIALSGYGTEKDVRRSREAGFAEHLTKPVDVDALAAAVRRLTARA